MRKAHFRLLVAVGALATVAAIAAPGSGTAATTGVCTLQGTAHVTPGLTTQTKAINYTFTGKFSGCQGTGNVKNGTVSASGSGTGSCSGNTTKGTASVKWNTGQTSSISFTTKGTGTLVNVTGKVTSGRFAGSKANANLLFSTTRPQDCLSSGVTSPSFFGDARLGI